MQASACTNPGKAEGGTGKPPPEKKKETDGGGGKGGKTAHSRQTARQHHQRRPTPPPRRHRRQDPQKGTGGRPTVNRQHQARNSGPPGEGTPKQAERKEKESHQPSPKERGWGDRDHKARDRNTKKKKKRKKTKAQKTHPDNPVKKGWAQPRPGPSTHTHTARRNRTRRGASGAPTKPHTSHKQADTEPQPRTPQTADTRGTTPNRAQTHPPKTPARTCGVNKTHTQPPTGCKHKRRTTVGNPVPTARALRQPVPCR